MMTIWAKQVNSNNKFNGEKGVWCVKFQIVCVYRYDVILCIVRFFMLMIIRLLLNDLYLMIGYLISRQNDKPGALITVQISKGADISTRHRCRRHNTAASCSRGRQRNAASQTKPMLHSTARGLFDFSTGTGEFI